MLEGKIDICGDDDMKLNEICEVYSGYALKTFNDDEDGFPVVKIGNILTDGTLNLKECQYTTDSVNEKYYSRSGDIYIALSGATTGKIGIMDVGEKYIINQRVGIVRKKLDSIPQEYIKYFLLKQTDRILQEAAGCAQPNISPKQIAEYVIPDASQEKMQEICEVLDRIKKIIDSRKAEISVLDNLIKARFIEMFGDPILNSKHLETKELKEVLTLKAGDFTAASDISNEPSEMKPYPCYGGNGIRGYVSDYNQDGEYSIVGRQGALSGNVQFARSKFKNTEHALLVTPIIEMNSIWLNQLLQNLDLKRFQTGAAQPGLSVKNLQNIPIICVPIDEQRRFAEYIGIVDKSKAAVQKSLDETQVLFDSLMQKYFG